MSKKSVPFKMPGKRGRTSEGGVKVLEGDQAATDTALPVSDAPGIGDAASHDWVRTRDAAPPSAPTATLGSQPAPVVARASVPDFSTMWNLWEAAALLLLSPSLLGSLWLFYYYRAKFAAPSGQAPS
jgi:hypothetical protein